MKLTEEEVTELYQYVTDERSAEYNFLKEAVREEMESGDESVIHVSISDYYLYGKSMMKIGRILSLYRLLYKLGALDYEEFGILSEEVYAKFDADSIREEIRNQRSIEK